MTEHLVGDYYVEIEYITAGAGPHVMTRSTGEWIGVPGEETGSFLAWDGSDVDAQDTIEALVTACLPLVTTATTFSSWIIYRHLDTDERPVIMASGTLTGFVGAAPTTSPFKAWQKTYSFRSADNNLGKFVLLDTPTGGSASKTPTVTGAELTLVNVLRDISNPWAARDGSRLAVFRSLSNGLNDELVRAYRL